jgi:hypothetical protein
MRRRDFIMLFGAAAVWPLAARAQQAGRLPTIGFLGASTPSAWSQWTAAFVQRLRELGWTEGRTVAIEYRWAGGRSERYADIAAEFVRLKVDVILSVGSAVAATKQATSTIPIVFDCGGPGRNRNGGFIGATGRQRHRHLGSVHRTRRQATRNLARSAPQVASIGDHRRCRLCWLCIGDIGGSGRSR